MNFKYYIPTRILFGTGSLQQLGDQELPGKKAMIVTTHGQSVKKYGYLDRVIEQLEKQNIEYLLFDKILPNPIKSHVNEGGRLAKDEHVNFIIGLGGGSAIDAAKAIAIMATNDGDYWDYVHGGTGLGKEVVHDPLPIVAITTTAGTGTEADPWTVTTKEETGEKIGSGYDKTFPFLSIVDPELMLTVPSLLTAYQGFDALFHSCEGYLNKAHNPISDMYALKSIELIGKSLEIVVKDGKNIKAREDVALANTLAGMVESISGCISEHSIAHAMSGYVPNFEHGAALISISKEYCTMLIEKHACDQRIIDMAKALGNKDAKKPQDFVYALVNLQAHCGVDGIKMSDYGMTYDDLPRFVQSARETMGGLFDSDPIEVSDNDVLNILQKSYK